MWLRILAAGVLSLVTITAMAKPAPWYLWQSRVDQGFLCTQVTPGEGWLKVGGPYTSAQCRSYIRELIIDPNLLDGKGKLRLLPKPSPTLYK